MAEAERPAPASDQRHVVSWMLTSISSRHRLPAAVVTQQETGMTQATTSACFRAARGGETKLFPGRPSGGGLSHSPKICIFLASDPHIPLDRINGNYPKIEINAWDSDHRTFPVGAIDSGGWVT